MSCSPDDHLKEAYEIFCYLISSESPDNYYPRAIMQSMLDFCDNWDYHHSD